MAKFKCIVSGNVIEFTNQVDIDSMVGHEGYIKLEEQVIEAPKEVIVKPTVAKKTTKATTQVEAE
jgi:hypothetical protein